MSPASAGFIPVHHPKPLKLKSTFTILGLFALLTSSALLGCSGGGDANEMAPLSDDELLKRGAAGHQAAGGAATAPTAEGQPGRAQETTGLPPGAPPPSMPKR
jgi:hypothetical protein